MSHEGTFCMNCYEALADEERCEECDPVRNVNCIKCGYTLGSNIACLFCSDYNYDHPEKDVKVKEKKFCKSCFYFKEFLCYRFPPASTDSTKVLPSNWCGEWRTR